MSTLLLNLTLHDREFIFLLVFKCRMSTSTGRLKMRCRRHLNTSKCGRCKRRVGRRRVNCMCCSNRFTEKSHFLSIDKGFFYF